jgi:hypothetical protein
MHLKDEGERMGPDLSCLGSVNESELKVYPILFILSADQLPWHQSGESVCGRVNFTKPWPADGDTTAKRFATAIVGEITGP